MLAVGPAGGGSSALDSTTMDSLSKAKADQAKALLAARPDDDDDGDDDTAVADTDADIDLSSVITQVTTQHQHQQQHVRHGMPVGAAAADADADADADDDAVPWPAGGFPQQHPHQQHDQQQPPQGWRARVQRLLCCFAPPGGGGLAAAGADAQQLAGAQGHAYAHGQGQGQGGAPLTYLPPQPPRAYREAVIGAKRPEDAHKKTLVLDLDETLVHSSFKPIPNPDYIIPVEIDGRLVDVYVLKRPWLDHFMNTVGPRFEVVVFTASLAKYADPLLDLMDKQGLVRWRLFRESCCPYEGNYVKDLCCLGRDLASTIIVDNSPHSYIFQPANAVPIGTFLDDMEDQELLEVLPQLLQVESVDDVRPYLSQNLYRAQEEQQQQQQQQQQVLAQEQQQQQQALAAAAACGGGGGGGIYLR